MDAITAPVLLAEVLSGDIEPLLAPPVPAETARGGSALPLERACVTLAGAVPVGLRTARATLGNVTSASEGPFSAIATKKYAQRGTVKVNRN